MFLAFAKLFLEKFSAVVIATIYTSLEIYSLWSRNFYWNRHIIIILICISTDLSLYIFNIYVLFSLNFWKKNERKTFVKHLRRDKQKNTRSFYLKFFILVLIDITIFACQIYYTPTNRKEIYLKSYTLRHIEGYIQLIFYYFICTVLSIIIKRYQLLQIQLSQNVSLEKIWLGMFFQKKSLEIFNQIFGLPLLFMLSYTFFSSLFCISTFLFLNYEIKQTVLMLLIFFRSLVPTLIMLYLCGCVKEEHKKIVLATYKIRWSFEHQKQTDQEVVNLIRNSAVKITTADFFNLDKGTILSLVNTVVSFIIVVVQFKN